MVANRTRLAGRVGARLRNRTSQTGLDMNIMPVSLREKKSVDNTQLRSSKVRNTKVASRGEVPDAEVSTPDNTEEAIDKKKEANDYLDQYKDIITSANNAKPAATDTENSYKSTYERDKEEPSDFTSSVDLNQFDELLSRLEASKKRQVRQKSVEDRRNTYAQGIASMMSNF